MAKYHINSKGNPGVCQAENGNCPFGGVEDHYPTKEMAQKHYEFIMAEKAFDSFNKPSKNEQIPAATYKHWKNQLKELSGWRIDPKTPLAKDNSELINNVYNEGLRKGDREVITHSHDLVKMGFVGYGNSIKKVFDTYPNIVKDLSWVDVNYGIVSRMESKERKQKFWQEASKAVPAETLTYWKRTKPSSAAKFKVPAPGPRKSYEDTEAHMNRLLGRNNG